MGPLPVPRLEQVEVIALATGGGDPPVLLLKALESALQFLCSGFISEDGDAVR